MKKLLVPLITLSLIMLPAAVHAADQCRNSSTGKYAKCGSPGAVPANQYVSKSKSAAKKPPAKTDSTMKASAATPAAKPASCKNAKGKFVKCGTPGAKPA